MRLSLRSSLCLLLTVSSCAAISIPTPSPSIRTISSHPPTNLSTLPNLPDDNFHVIASWYHPALSETACIMVCITAMRELALLYFEDDDIPQKAWTHPQFPGVELTVGPASESEKLTVRFAMWMIAAVTRFMMAEDRFQSAHFTGFYRGERVGVVTFFRAASDVGGQNSSISQQPQASAIVAGGNILNGVGFNFDGMNSGAARNANDQMRAEVNYLGTSINRRDMLMMIIWLLLWLAPRNREPLGVWRMAQPLLTCEVITLWNRVKQDQYLMTGGDLISFLAYLPEQLLRDNRFEVMDILIKEADVVVARGSFRVKPLTGLLGLPPARNVTFS